MNPETIQSEIQILIIRSFEGNITPEEQESLRQWLEEAAEHRAFYREMERLWLQAGAPARYDVEVAWQQVATTLPRKQAGRRSRLFTALKYAASFLLLLGAGWGIWRLLDRSEEAELVHPGTRKALLVVGEQKQIQLVDGMAGDLISQHTGARYEEQGLTFENVSDAEAGKINHLITPRGGEYSVTLSDGTRVWLNADSELRFPARFTGEFREVWLEGEAYFDVARNEQAPFIIHSGGVKMEVLGTSFNVRHYDTAQPITTLLSGSLRLEYLPEGGPAVSCLLAPGQQAIVSGDHFSVMPADLEEVTAWRKDYFIFRGRSLGYIMDELARWYDFTWSAENDDLDNISVNAKIRKYNSIQDVLDILRETQRYDFTLEGKEVRIREK